MRILVTGAAGQLGRAALRRASAVGYEAIATDVHDLDIRIPRSVDERLRVVAPDLVINAAAYTAVDKAETEKDLAFAINATGARNVARACAAQGVRLVHVSTDYVFDGTATAPYAEDAPIAPQSVYGETKAAGEVAVREHGGTIVRTSWLFEERGPSFVHTMLRLAGDRAVLRVVADQVGCPTWADDLAAAAIALAQHPVDTYHYCNDGVTSWHGFACAIIDEARTSRELACERVEPITTADYPTPARRPAYSVLDTTKIRRLGIVPPSWRSGLAHVVARALDVA